MRGFGYVLALVFFFISISKIQESFPQGFRSVEQYAVIGEFHVRSRKSMPLLIGMTQTET